jgi:DNA polymerase III gamma/tau subunit
VDRDLTRGLKVINEAVDGGADPRELARQTADFLRGLLLMRLGAGHTWTDPTADERATFEEMAIKANPDHLVEAVRLFSDVAAKQRTGWQPQLPLELAFVEAALHTGAAPAAIGVSSSSAVQASSSQPASGAATRTQSATQTSAATRTSSAPRTSAKNQTSAGTTPAPETKTSAPQQETSRAAQPSASGRDEEDARPARASGGNAVAESRPASSRASDARESSSDAPASPAPSEPAASSSSGIGSELLETIRTNWQGLIRQMPVSIGALLRDASVGGLDSQSRLVLAFKHNFHCEKIAEDTNLRKLEGILSRAYGQTIPVYCVLEENWHPQQPRQPQQAAAKAGTPSQGSSASSQPDAEDSDDETSLEEDELIRRAQEELGAVARMND